MNSEELEQSLRTEFESYLKNVLADMRQDVSDFQKQFEAEFEKHKAQIDEVFQNFSSRISTDRELDSSFTESVVEHLRLARDEGARITATAIAEAEEMEKQNAVQAESAENSSRAFSFSEIREAINDISTKTTQSSILKTLVNHAAQFTPRGAFFIIKNEHLVGWRMFGKDGETVDEMTVREVFFPAAASTVLGEAVRSLSAVESAYGVYSDDSIYLNKLEFGQPEQMFAVPLVVRGRTVAVLYADRGINGGEVNIDALESLVRVASMTVEILASSRGAHMQTEAAEETSANYGSFNAQESPAQETQTETTFTEPAAEEYQSAEAAQSYQFAKADTDTTNKVEETAAAEETVEETYSYQPSVDEDYSYQPIEQPVETIEAPVKESYFESDGFSFKPSSETESPAAEFVSEEAVATTEQEKQAEFQTEAERATAFDAKPAWGQPVETADYYSNEPAISYEAPSGETETPAYEVSDAEYQTEAQAEADYAPSLNGRGDYQFEADRQEVETSSSNFDATGALTNYETPSYETPAYEEPSYEAPQYEAPQYEAPQYETESPATTNGSSFDRATTENGKAESFVEQPVEAVAVETTVKQPSRSRFSERNVDLPIEVSEEDRRLHNDARRFARLLVSEIKLYNEQRVKEGRQSNDLYERLREAIDRSREMYDKRVQPPVAAKFDYFHYELVSNLAEGDSTKLGASYPGAAV